ncbi:MAG: SMI1/KNR4 family protein [Syntrophomonas sp.]
MNEVDFGRIEQTFNIVLPSDYKQLLGSYPEVITEARELQLSDDPEWLIEQNLYIREQPEAFFGKRKWLSEHFIIGEDGNGNCFYLNLKHGSPAPIFIMNHDSPDEHDIRIAPSFESWIPKIRTELDEYQKNRACLQESRQKHQKPWWKFW